MPLTVGLMSNDISDNIIPPRTDPEAAWVRPRTDFRLCDAVSDGVTQSVKIVVNRFQP